MSARGITVVQLAKECGLSVASVRWQMNAAAPVPRSAWKIERLFGCAIWTDQTHFDDLTKASQFLGYDFILTKFHPLRSAAVAKAVRDTRTITHKDALLVRVLEHISELQAASTVEASAPTHAQTTGNHSHL